VEAVYIGEKLSLAKRGKWNFKQPLINMNVIKTTGDMLFYNDEIQNASKGN
jgi:hypothetical protein